jgi:hypothetical protein
MARRHRLLSPLEGLAALLTACALDTARHPSPPDEAVAWIWDSSASAPQVILRSRPRTPPVSWRAHAAHFARAVSREAARLPEPPFAAVVLTPGPRGARRLEAASVASPRALSASYADLLSSPDAPTQTVPASRSIAARLLARATAARLRALH